MTEGFVAAPVSLRGPARRRRLAAAGIVFGLLLAGTAWGQDDHFPFGPFRMYATRQRLDGSTTWYHVQARTAAGKLVDVPGSAYGLRRAELEGQIPRFVAQPALLSELLEAYERRVPDGPELVEIHLVKSRQRLHAGRPVGDVTDKVLVTWSR